LAHILSGYGCLKSVKTRPTLLAKNQREAQDKVWADYEVTTYALKAPGVSLFFGSNKNPIFYQCCILIYFYFIVLYSTLFLLYFYFNGLPLQTQNFKGLSLLYFRHT
jgi:hypothetical protein